MALSAPHHLEEIYSMSIQLALHFDEAPVTCETQQRYQENIVAKGKYYVVAFLHADKDGFDQ
jgi:hypothetical protein